MNKLTAEVAFREICRLKGLQKNSENGLSMREDKFLQALEIALPVLERDGGWINCSERMPEEGGRYWCYVAEQNSLGLSHYQWNCSWNGDIWSDAALSGTVTHWMPLPAPPQPQPATNPQIDNEGWIDWGGGECPLARMTVIEAKFTLTPQGKGLAYWWDWHHVEGDNNIIAYRVIENDGREG